MREGRTGSGLEGLVPPPCGQLTRCFSAVAEFLVLLFASVCNLQKMLTICDTNVGRQRDILFNAKKCIRLTLSSFRLVTVIFSGLISVILVMKIYLLLLLV